MKEQDKIPPDWARAIRRDERLRTAIEKWRAQRRDWVAGGKSGKEPPEPWEKTDWVALGSCPRARSVLRTMAATSGVDDLEDFRDLLRCAAMAAGAFDRRGGSIGRGLFTAFQETLLVLSNAVNVVRASEEERNTDERHAPPARDEGIDTALLETFHAPARRALAAAKTEALRIDGQRTGIRFTDAKTGKPLIAAAGREVVRALERYLAKGLRGSELADAIAHHAVWINGAFSEFSNIRWKDPPGFRERDSHRNRLERWATNPTTDFDDVKDYELLAVSMLRALGMSTKKARNAVSAANDMKERRKRRG